MGMTNGEKLQKIFPNLEYEILSRTVLTNIDNEAWFSLDWWNAEYKEPTTKNDLGVDCISREKAIKWAEFYTNIYDAEVANKEIMKMLKEMPSVTPIRPKGHWIEHEKSISTAFKHLRECSCCKCYFDWIMPRNSYCPNCGSDNREVENE